MNTDRRKFFHVVAGGLGLIVLTTFTTVVTTFAQRAIKPKGKHPKDVLCGFQPSPGKRPLFSKRIICSCYIAREVVPGYIPRQNLIDEQDCSKCNFEDVCKASGTRFAFAKSKYTRTYFPTLFSRIYKNEFVNG